MIDGYLVDIDTHIKNYEIVKGMVLKQLYDDKVISQNEFEKYMGKYGVIIINTAWYKNLFKKDKDGYELRFVKLTEK